MAPRSILKGMSVNLLRRLLVLLIVAAYIGATSMAPMAYAGAPDMNSSMMHDQDGHSQKMPCNGMKHGCFSELGCIFLLSVPTPDIRLFTTRAWSSVTYNNTSEALRGRSIEPALGPPISHA
jgi:hypothetical protein